MKMRQKKTKPYISSSRSPFCKILGAPLIVVAGNKSVQVRTPACARTFITRTHNTYTEFL